MSRPLLIGRKQARIMAPPGVVFRYLADLSRYAEWNPEPGWQASGARPASADFGAVYQREMQLQLPGTLMRGASVVKPVEAVRTTAIAGYAPDARLTLGTKVRFNGLLHSSEWQTFELQPAPGGGCLVTLTEEIEPALPRMFLGPSYALRLARGVLERAFGGWLARYLPATTAGPELTRIKQQLEGPFYPILPRP